MVRDFSPAATSVSRLFHYAIFNDFQTRLIIVDFATTAKANPEWLVEHNYHVVLILIDSPIDVDQFAFPISKVLACQYFFAIVPRVNLVGFM
jgi:hypothetical protein